MFEIFCFQIPRHLFNRVEVLPANKRIGSKSDFKMI